MAEQSHPAKARLPAHLALRIALASRSLKSVEIADLLKAVIHAVGEPITEARLAKLRAARLRAKLEGVCPPSARIDELTNKQLHSALGLLKGRGVEMPAAPLPEVQPYSAGDMPDSVRVACSSDTGEQLDGIFSRCSRFLIYQVSAREARLIEVREPGRCPRDADRYAYRAEMIGDCHLLYTLSIGGPASAKVVRSGVHPIRVNEASAAPGVMAELQGVLGAAPPPWLAKVMAGEQAECARISNDSTA